MSKFMFKNFEMTRYFFFREMNGLTEEMANVQPAGFNNNIRWHVGHVLTVTEQFMFGFPKKSQHLPENYPQLFGNGTKPADWTGEVPTLDELKSHLENQLERLKIVPEESLDQELKQPFRGLKTFGELANMALYHEAHHMGQIHAMKRIVETAAVKN
ncbi:MULTISPECIES: DinB family protein [unclassified Bacillus (in: firmicutes)]|uniref:DinB family protein n=1 Tax=unclassified Bacillus (in: firmicutes) TaxID=185979 RepID=UPI0008EA0B5F|nr:MULTISPECIES: DinB family protein [unclassified Bacillus (in: firmicutes)]SFB23726.1 DinB superfamily protein [Bacillus sp. UNCCL13]SFQ87923.1 DinB superfamily protein [Bacillus sp. cl95]